MRENLPIFFTAVIFLIVGLLCIIQPLKFKLWTISGSEEEVDRPKNKIYFIMLRFFGAVSIIASLAIILMIND